MIQPSAGPFRVGDTVRSTENHKYKSPELKLLKDFKDQSLKITKFFKQIEPERQYLASCTWQEEGHLMIAEVPLHTLRLIKKVEDN